jgi:hypothetical protein
MDLLDKIRQERKFIQSAPFSFIVCLALGGSVGYVAAHWYYSKQLADLTGLTSRYQIALGLKDPTGGAIAQLTNAELKAMVLRTAGQMRTLYYEFQKRMDDLEHERKSPGMTDVEYQDRNSSLVKELGKSFTMQLRSDASVEDSELRRRLPASVQQGMVLIAADETRVGFLSEVPDLVVQFYLEHWSTDLEKMAKALPND